MKYCLSEIQSAELGLVFFKALLKQITFLKLDLCRLSFGSTEAYAVLVFCEKHHEHLGAVGLIVNLLSELT
jgi:hypothetical protein